MGLETDTGLFKVGDGKTVWIDLPYGGLQGVIGITGPTGVSEGHTGPTGATGPIGEKGPPGISPVYMVAGGSQLAH